MLAKMGMLEPTSGLNDQKIALIHEMALQNYDLIRFASYRTAVKLRFIQKKVCLSSVDIWNIIEAFREQGLHALEPTHELSVARLETLLCSLYHSLNKRAPFSQQVNVEICSSLLLNWLLSAYSTLESVGKIRVFSIKIALATLCAGKLMDKLRYVFSQISDGNGLLIHWRFNEYLQEVLALPAAVYESPTFNYHETISSTIFNPSAKVTVNDFLDVMMSDPGPAVLLWLPLVHRIASVESTVHNIQCDSCKMESFFGFRYKCVKCPNYNLCQDCFWRGRITPPHNLDHQVKEYASFSPNNKTLGSLRKSFRCVPDKQTKNHLPKFPERPEKTLNLSHIVPPSPVPSHNGFPDGPCVPFDRMGSLDSRSSTTRSLDSARDDEHRLIARYAAKLAQETGQGMASRSCLRRSSLSPDAGRVSSEACLGMDSTRAQRELIGQLEAKNREIMREIARLRRQQELEGAIHGQPENPLLMNELRALRMRKDELESHLSTLQDSRRQLMIQLEGLMKMLKNHQTSTVTNVTSPRSTPNTSPRGVKSPPTTPKSAPQTPETAPAPAPCELNNKDEQITSSSSSSYVDEMKNAFHGNNDFQNVSSRNKLTNGSNNGNREQIGRSLRNDLLVAADSVTNAMSTLVRELNSDFEDDGDESDDNGSSGKWQEELQRRYEQDANFMAELRARQNIISPPGVNSLIDEANFYQFQNASSTGNGSKYMMEEQYAGYNNCNTKQYSHENGRGISLETKENRDKIQFEEALKHWVNSNTS